MNVFDKFEKVNDSSIRYFSFNDCYTVSLKKNEYMDFSKIVFIDEKISVPKVVYTSDVQNCDISAIVLPKLSMLTDKMAEQLLGVFNQPIYVSHLPLVKVSKSSELKLVKTFNV